MFGTKSKVKILKENEEDFEFYPTTDEIFQAIEKDIFNTCVDDKFIYRQSKRSKIKRDCNYSDNKRNDYIIVDSFLDIGAGDGRVFNKVKSFRNNNIRITNKLGIEKSKQQANDLIINGVGLIGRDYLETVLIDKFYDIVFSNPPYSIFKQWVSKMLQEVNASLIYLVIPERWKNDDNFKAQFYKKGEVTILGSFDFKDGEREARAKIDLIKIIPDTKNDTFNSWVENNIGLFEVNETIIEEPIEEIKRNELDSRNSNSITVLVENYKKDMTSLMDTFISLGKIDFSIIKQLGVEKQDVINKVRSDIESLKNKYWLKTFDTLKVINEKLTSKTREALRDNIQWFKELDFNSNNIYTIIIWVIENFNNYTKQQLLEVYKDLTDFEKVRAYKSNDRWIKDSWRYEKSGGRPEKYALDYRIVVPIGYRISGYQYNRDNNPIADLSIVATSLGFANTGVDDYDIGKKHNCLMLDGSVLFEYKVYQNNNVHFKLNKKLLMAMNIEVGKLKNWIKAPSDIQEEFNVSESVANTWFTESELQLINEASPLMISFQK